MHTKGRAKEITEIKQMIHDETMQQNDKLRALTEHDILRYPLSIELDIIRDKSQSKEESDEIWAKLDTEYKHQIASRCPLTEVLHKTSA